MIKKVPIKEVPNPKTLTQHLYENDEDYIMLLESGQGYFERARYTIIAWGVERHYVHYPDDTSDPYIELKSLVKSCSYDFPSHDLLIGYLSYEACTLIEPYLKNYVQDWGKWPLIEFIKPKYVIIYDNLLGRVYTNTDIPRYVDIKDSEFKVHNVKERIDREIFEEWVSNALERIKFGEIFQVVLSRWIIYEVSGNYFKIYERLSNINPSPYMYFTKFQNKYIIGTSPELLVKVSDYKVETHPIAGTRPRGRDVFEDLKLEDELIESEKDRAEHIMLVDLARNDLGKICKYGTVKTTSLFTVEKYSHVQHLVSRVEGVLDKGMNIIDALWATFPAGTVTGAPKPRAMELIFHYEKRAREPYAGAIGFMNCRGGEFAIIIRSIIISGDEMKLQAGAGLVHDSKPELEYLETQHKLEAMLKSIET